MYLYVSLASDRGYKKFWLLVAELLVDVSENHYPEQCSRDFSTERRCEAQSAMWESSGTAILERSQKLKLLR